MANNLSVFELNLTDYIIKNHPDKIENKEFIKGRANDAAKQFELSSKEEKGIDICKEEAYHTLYAGLLFSKYVFLKDLILEEFGDMGVAEIHPFIMQMMDLLKPVFDKYELTDSFVGSEKEKELYTLCLGEIFNYLEKNGIQ